MRGEARKCAQFFPRFVWNCDQYDSQSAEVQSEYQILYQTYQRMHYQSDILGTKEGGIRRLVSNNWVHECATRQVGVGYLKREEETQKRFITHVSLGKCFRTGDVFRATSNGWEFVGRKDAQVKLRGRRIELGMSVAVYGVYADMHAHTYVHVFIYIYIFYVFTCKSICTHASTYVYMFTMYVHVHVSMHVYTFGSNGSSAPLQTVRVHISHAWHTNTTLTCRRDRRRHPPIVRAPSLTHSMHSGQW